VSGVSQKTHRFLITTFSQKPFATKAFSMVQFQGTKISADPVPKTCQPWIKITPQRLFHWEGTIKKYHIMTVGGILP